MRRPTSLFLLPILLSTTTTTVALPQPLVLTNLTYWGSACPSNGLTATLGPLNTTTNTVPLSFTLANLLPALDGGFGSSLRMCDIVGGLGFGGGGNGTDEEEKWRVVVNRKGTQASGYASVGGNATMYLRGTYSFAEDAGRQSIGTLDVKGPLSGPFARPLVPDEDAAEGIVGPCGSAAPAELSIEFQARAVKDLEEDRGSAFGKAANETDTAWVMRTEVEVERC